ncbi:hypothetical protein [Arsenicibacter rosenii]|uniref:Transposase n=1 Tax=Arsenicibacter rosenii TaxID=1750698 RepID=A0A1S2VEU4_9BACT|nr:hypothetical protein [Arsenicibacter rosenii]OIN57271.1 hypothetical protein BLX24_20010 [Arsenicibacter rosenii]
MHPPDDDLFPESPTLRKLYDYAKARRDERQALAMREKHMRMQLQQEIDDLTGIMNLLVLAFRKAMPENKP